MPSLGLAGPLGWQIGVAYVVTDILVVVLALLVAAAAANRRAVAQAYPRGRALYPVAALAAYYYGQGAPAAVAAAAALPVLAQHHVGYVVFHLANALGVYRTACSGHVLAALAHAALSLSSVGQEGQQAAQTLFSRLFFMREIRLIRLCKLRKLTIDDIWELPSRHRLENAHREFTYDVNQRLFLGRAIVRLLWRPLVPLLLLQAAVQALDVIKITARGYLLACLGAPASYPWYYGYCAALCELLASILRRQTGQLDGLVEAETQGIARVLQLELFRLPLVRGSQRKYRIGEYHKAKVRRLVSNLQPALMTIPHAISLFVSFTALYCHVGWLAAIPAAAPAAMDAANRLGTRVLGYRGLWLPNVHAPYDTRTDEIYGAIRTIKLFGWERMHTDPKLMLQDDTRPRLPWYAPAGYLLWAVFGMLSTATHAGSSYLMMRIHMAGQSPAASGYSYTGLVNVHAHAQGVSRAAQRVIEMFTHVRMALRLMLDVESDIRGQPFDTLPQGDDIALGKAPAVAMNGCSFTWNQKRREPVLEDVSLDAKDGKLVAVVGKTGAGKSSLLLAVCGELEMTSGSGGVTGKIAYLEQQPWIMNDTLRANVLFGREYDQAFFEEVVHACALVDDLARWPDADLTVIGERGINISGGQRARLALARTLYSRADVYVLDDPLSAVDAHVKRHILDHVLLDSGMLAGKLRIVATNSEHILPYAHQVVTLEDRCATVSIQTPQIYSPLSPGELVADHTAATEDAGSDAKEANVATASPAVDNRQVAEVVKRSYWDNAVYTLQLCGWPVLAAIVASSLIEPVGEYVVSAIQLAISGSAGGVMSRDDVLLYIRLQVLSLMLSQIGLYIQEIVQSYVVKQHLEARIKGQLIESILHAPISFFDGTTRQHLSSIYASGAAAMSRDLPKILTRELATAVGSALGVYRAVRTAPYLLLVVPVAAWLKRKQSAVTSQAGGMLWEIKREADIARSRTSFIVGDGQQLIRLFGVGPYFARLHMRNEDKDTQLDVPLGALTAFYRSISAIPGHAGSMLTASLLLLRAQLSRVGVSPAGLDVYRDLVELLLHNTHTVADLPNRIRRVSDVVDVYRQYASIEPEAPYVVEGCRPQSSWPQAGRVEFRDFSLRYRADLPPALDGINLTINAGEKIGIVGRTGAGKSTLAKSLFRLVHGTTSGTVLIDGQDISEMGVGDLRPRLGTIPQESVMFWGSYRKNLDPLREHTVEDMWAALIRAGIASEVAPVRTAPGDTSMDDDDIEDDYKRAVAGDSRRWAESGWAMRLAQLALVAEPIKRPEQKYMTPLHGLHRIAQSRARGLSSGQQQLFSLCRTLMRRRRVIVLDEATANVDLATDREMQRIIRSEFSDCTVLTIAHRLETIMDCDRIVVMDRGRIAEVGSPKDLIDAGGHFAELVRANDFGS